MAHMTPYEFNSMMKRIRCGEKVTCPSCKNGVFETNGEHKTSLEFHCSYCKKRIIIDPIPPS